MVWEFRNDPRHILFFWEICFLNSFVKLFQKARRLLTESWLFEMQKRLHCLLSQGTSSLNGFRRWYNVPTYHTLIVTYTMQLSKSPMNTESASTTVSCSHALVEGVLLIEIALSKIETGERVGIQAQWIYSSQWNHKA